MTKRMLTTGAAGQFGSGVLEALLRTVPPERVAATARDPEKAAGLRGHGVDLRRGDFDDAASLDEAFAGVDRLLIVSTSGDNDSRIRQHRAAVEAARRARVTFIAYTSLANADRNPMRLAAVHRDTEEAIRATGIPYSFLRNNWYAENEAGTIQGVMAGAPIATAAGAGRIGWASRGDLAQAAATVLAGGHENTVYELSGPPATYASLAQTVGEVLEREVPVRELDDTEYEQMIAGFGLPGYVVELLVDAQRAMRQGALDVQSGDLERLLGRPATPLKAVVERIVAGARAAG